MKTQILRFLAIALVFASCSPGALDQQEVPTLAVEETPINTKRLRTPCEQIESNRQVMTYSQFIPSVASGGPNFPVEQLIDCRESEGTLCQRGSLQDITLAGINVQDILDDEIPHQLTIGEQEEILARISQQINNNLAGVYAGATLVNIIDIYDIHPNVTGLILIVARIQYCESGGGSSYF